MPPSPILLAIDASTELCSVCWTDGARWIERREDAGQRHSALIIALVDSALREAGCGVRDLDEIAFGSGPGSFTGLRIACGIAQGLAFGAGLPVRGISSLLAIAQAAAECAVIAALDARMNEVYWAAYRRAADGAWDEVTAPEACPAASVSIPPGDDWSGAGNGFARYASLVAVLPARSRIDPGVEVTARAIAELALAGQGEVSAAEHASPLYVRDKVAMTVAERAARR